jgi:hypothetical protein
MSSLARQQLKRGAACLLGAAFVAYGCSSSPFTVAQVDGGSSDGASEDSTTAHDATVTDGGAPPEASGTDGISSGDTGLDVLLDVLNAGDAGGGCRAACYPDVLSCESGDICCMTGPMFCCYPACPGAH